ncbi:GON-4-like protein isoform X4 [Oncorhynchus masou masou]|uniref:GON-4-like protein isoform X4 n=1 Tax=Oncorhynchus masou masou TaxID=90313 RepID=UPI003182C35F
MTKAAIQEMQDLALFSIPTWNISPIKRALEVKPPQFVDIPLEEKDDSSDEEYCLDKEDETAEEKPRQPRHLRVETVPMGPPSSTGPARPLRAQVCTFLEKLYAVEEELELSPICTETFQFQDDELIVNGQDDDGHEEDEEREEAAPPLSAP